MKVIICNDIITEIKRTGFDTLNQSLLTIKTKWIPASFTVSKAIKQVIIITFGSKNLINRTGNNVANLNPDRNQKQVPTTCRVAWYLQLQLTKLFIPANLNFANFINLFYEENFKLCFMHPCDPDADKV
jgi:hypothetical protein